jgi:hypothetical protein
MERFVSYAAAIAASSLGWNVGRHLGTGTGFVLAVLAAGIGMYLTRRWLRQHLG